MNDDFDPIRWAIAEADISIAEAVRRILGAPAVTAASVPVTAAPRAAAPTPAMMRRRTLLEQLVDFVDGEFEVRAADVVAYGLTTSRSSASALLGDAVAQGRIDRLRPGVYGPKGSASPAAPTDDDSDDGDGDGDGWDVDGLVAALNGDDQ